MDVGPFVVADAEASELIEPGEGVLHDPAPATHATPMLGAAHGQQGHDVASSKATPNGSRIVAAIPEHTVRPLSGSPPFAVQRGNRIDQR